MDFYIRNYSSPDRDAVLRICELGPLPLNIPLDSLRGARKFVAACGDEIIGFGAIDVQIACTACAHATVLALCAENEDAAKALRNSLEGYAKSCWVSVIRNRL